MFSLFHNDHLLIFSDDEQNVADDKKNIKLNKREKIEREKDFQEKRKAKKNLSQNINTKKTRDRFFNFSSLKKELKLRKNANKSIIDRNVKMLKRISEYENVSNQEKKLLIQKCKNRIVIKRLMMFFLLIFLLINFFSIAKQQHVFVFAFEKDLMLNFLNVRLENDHNSA
jgi:Fe2+ transport system protein B